MKIKNIRRNENSTTVDKLNLSLCPEILRH